MTAKRSSIHNIAKNAGIIFWGNSTSSAINLISFTIMAKQLGPGVLAIFVLAQTYTAIFSDIFNIQTWESVVKFGPEKNNSNDLADVLNFNLGLDVVSALLACLAAISVSGVAIQWLHWDLSSHIYLIVYSLTNLTKMTTLTVGVPRLFEQFFPVAQLGILTAAVKLVGVVIAMRYSNNLPTYVGLFLSCEILNNLMISLFSVKLLNTKLQSHWWKRPIILDRRQLHFIWWTNLRSIIRIPVRHFDMLIIASVMSMEQVGIYKVYKEIGNVINRIGDPVNQAIFPEFTKLLSKRAIHSVIAVIKRSTVLLSATGTILTFTLLFSAKLLLRHFFGEEYLPEINALYWLLILFGINFSIAPINSLFIAAGFARYSFLIVLLTNTLYLCCAFGFGAIFGMYGVIMAYAVQMIINQGLKGYFLWKHSAEWGLLNK